MGFSPQAGVPPPWAARRFHLSCQVAARRGDAARKRTDHVRCTLQSASRPSHVLPASLPADALAFAFRGDEGAGRRRPTMRPSVPDARRARSRLGVAGHGALPRRAGRHRLRRRRRSPTTRRSPPGWRYRGPALALLPRCPSALLAIAARAFQIVEWDRTHRYCGRCGTPTRDKSGERAKECPGLRPHRLSARLAGDDGARHARPRGAARARAALSPGHVQRARRLRRARRDDRGLHPPRSARGSGDRSRRHHATSRASRGRFRTR